jgi:predicted nucleic acid-binding protein
MERPKYLIDTNAIIDYLGNKMSASGIAIMRNAFKVKPNISIITKIEIMGFNRTVEHYQLLENFMNDVNVIGLSDTIADRTIYIRKLYKIKLPDAIIAATAIEFESTLITRNTTDFKNISGIKTQNPYQ